MKKKWKLRDGCTIEKTLPIDELVVSQILEKMSQDIGGEFYTKTKNLLSRIQNNEFNPIYTRIDMEDLSGHLQSIAVVEEAICKKQSIKALYKTDNEAKEVELNPLKLANFEGFWYLITLDNENEYVKKYHFKSLSGITLLDHTDAYTDIKQFVQDNGFTQHKSSKFGYATAVAEYDKFNFLVKDNDKVVFSYYSYVYKDKSTHQNIKYTKLAFHVKNALALFR